MEACTFSINDYDRDGDIFEEGIFLHFGVTRVKVADSLNEFAAFIEHLNKIYTEIRENYQMMDVPEPPK